MTASTSSIPLLFFKGSHYELGYQMASTYSNLVKHYYENSEDWLSQFESFYHMKEGKTFCESYWKIWERDFPQYLDELQGISDGSGVPLLKIKLAHLERELATKLGLYRTVFKDIPLGCTDVLITNSEEILIGHNEDWVADMIGYDILVNAHIEGYTAKDGTQFPEEKFVVHTWPGILPGMNSGFNHHGMFFSIDHLYPNQVEPGKLADLFLSRHLLTATSQQDVMNILHCDGYGASLGFSVNVGFIGEMGLWNIEVGADGTNPRSKVDSLFVESEIESEPGHYAHFNNYERLSIPSLRLEHCLERQKTYNEVAEVPLRSLKDLRNIIGNADDKFPIYQKLESDRQWATVASVILDVGRQKMHLFRGSPKTSDPVASLPFSLLENNMWEAMSES